MNQRTLTAAVGLAVAGLTLGGCAKDKSADGTPAGTSGATAKAAPMPPKAMTHVVTKDVPFYASPRATSSPLGTIKGGSKVLLVIPGADFAQVETADGATGYVMTDAVESLATPAPARPAVSVPPQPADKPGVTRAASVPPTPGPAVVPPAVVEPPKPAVPAPADKPGVNKAAATPAPAPVPDKVMTHVLTKPQPFYAAVPTAAAATPTGTLPAGTKVLLVIPGSDYCQVETPTGATVYTMTDGVESITKK